MTLLGYVLSHYLVVSGLVFTIGAVGFLVRRNVLIQLMSIELMLNAVNLSLVAYDRAFGGQNGQVLAFFVIAVAAAEAAVGLAIVLTFYRLNSRVASDEADLLRH